MTGRTAAPSDAPRVAALLEACAAPDGSASLDADEIRAWLRTPDLEPEDFRLVEAGDALAAYGDVTLRGDSAWLDARVHPDHRAGAALAELLVWAEGRARKRGAARLRASIAAGAGDAVLAGRGYRRIRCFFEMRIPLAGEPRPPAWPDGIAVRPLAAGEEERVHAAVQEAFEDHWEHVPRPYEAWIGGWRAHGYDPSLWFLALAGDELAGVALASVLGGGLGWVDTLAVRRPWRRRGLGEALLLHALRELRARGAADAGLDVDGENETGAVRLYERAGMRVAHRRDSWQLDLR